MRYSFLFLGALFGFILSRAGATTYDYYAELFLFIDLQLMWVIATAAGVGAVGIGIMKRVQLKSLTTGQPIAFAPRPMKKGLVAGSLLFGVGWGLAGACPGTVLAMLGEGKLTAGFTIGGILLGTWLYGVTSRAPTPKTPAPQPSPG